MVNLRCIAKDFRGIRVDDTLTIGKIYKQLSYTEETNYPVVTVSNDHDEICVYPYVVFSMVNENDFIPKFCVAFIDSDDDVVHAAFYENRPNVVSLLDLFEELVIDEEFGMDRDYVAGLAVRIFQAKDGGDIMDIIDPKPEGPVNEIWGPL